MTTPLFLYGTLCHAALREAVLGLGHVVSEARFSGHRVHWAEGQDFPVIVPGAGEAVGLLVEGLDDEAQARADWFEGGFGYRLSEVKVNVEGRGPVTARCYLPDDVLSPGADWSLDDWVRDHAEVWLEATQEAMAVFQHERGQGSVLGHRWEMMKSRAATRIRARETAPAHRYRADFRAQRDVQVVAERFPHTVYFSLADHDLKYRRFDGAMSPVVRRAGFVGGDAVTVLPWDPVLDAVLVVEQFRTGPFLRGDPNPWTLEPIAGRIDPGESPEDALRREAREEAGIELGRLHPIASYYPTPGAVTEYLFSYVAEADLSGRGGEIGGVDHEDEDIRAHLISRQDMMMLIASGEAGTGPLLLSMFWLEANRARLSAR